MVLGFQNYIKILVYPIAVNDHTRMGRAQPGMKLHLETGGGQHLIRGYAPGYVTVNDVVHRQSLIVLADRIIADWPPQAWSELRAEHINQIVALRPEIVLIGTGESRRQPPPAVLAPLLAGGLGWEVMDTGAACRTYNILLGEGRRVAAGLLMIAA